MAVEFPALLHEAQATAAPEGDKEQTAVFSTGAVQRHVCRLFMAGAGRVASSFTSTHMTVATKNQAASVDSEILRCAAAMLLDGTHCRQIQEDQEARLHPAGHEPRQSQH